MTVSEDQGSEGTDQLSALGKLSVGVVFTSSDEASALLRLQDIVDNLSDDNELIVVVNDVREAQTKQLVEITDQLADCTMLFVEPALDYDAAQLIILDNAIGDTVMLAALEELDPDSWSSLVAGFGVGQEMVVGAYPSARGPKKYRLLRSAYLGSLRKMTGLPVRSDLSRTRLLSRDAARYLLGRRDALLLLKCSGLGANFPSIVVELPDLSESAASRGIRPLASKAYRTLNVASAAPIRSVVVLAMIGAVLNLLYSGYVLGSYYLSAELAPGWATLSLQFSGMFFLFSLLFALLGEYIVSIDRATNQRIRYSVVREIRSNRTRTTRLRNVVEVSSGRLAHQLKARAPVDED